MSGCSWRGIDSETVKFCAQFFKMLIQLSDRSSSSIKPPIVVIAHSQGALIADMGLSKLSLQERQRIRVFTLGGASLVLSDRAHTDSHNYFSVADIITRGANNEISLFLLELHEGKKAGCTVEQVIEYLIRRDFERLMTTQVRSTIDEFRRRRLEYYGDLLDKAQNVTILGENRSGTWEHAFLAPCYQDTLKKIIQEYKLEPAGCQKHDN